MENYIFSHVISFFIYVECTVKFWTFSKVSVFNYISSVFAIFWFLAVSHKKFCPAVFRLAKVNICLNYIYLFSNSEGGIVSAFKTII